jgi:hypothetical protein
LASSRYGANERGLVEIRTGEAFTIAERRVVTFKASALFRAYVNDDTVSDQEAVAPSHIIERSADVDS